MDLSALWFVTNANNMYGEKVTASGYKEISLRDVTFKSSADIPLLSEYYCLRVTGFQDDKS